MKPSLNLTIVLLAGCVIGAAVAAGIQAQAKPPAFTIAEIDVIDPEGFKVFAKLNGAGMAAAGGRTLVLRGRMVTSNGTPPKGIALIAWDSLDTAIGYFNSPTFKELIPMRDKSAKVRLFHVEGLAK